jgi:hypothetical protein
MFERRRFENCESRVAIGSFLRRVLSAPLARKAGEHYRAIFVDLDKEADALSSVIPMNSHVLDVGGGDGQPLNHLLALRSDLRVTTLDPGASVGQWIDSRHADRVTCLRRTGLDEYFSMHGSDPDTVLIADVLHHIPLGSRAAFLRPLKSLLERKPLARIIVKDVEPGHWRAILGYWADRYITGDFGVSPISSEGLLTLLNEELGPLQREDTRLFERDKPNYLIAFFR